MCLHSYRLAYSCPIMCSIGNRYARDHPARVGRNVADIYVMSTQSACIESPLYDSMAVMKKSRDGKIMGIAYES